MQTLATLGLLEHDLAFWNAEPFREYRPQFAVAAQGADILWLTAHGQRMALVHKPYDQIDLFEFFPGQPRLAQPELPAVYHAPSLLGAKLTMIQWLHWEQGRSSDTWDLQGG